jgi:prepilin-type N-terminal cleavage/methylation domain-containing protein
VVALLFLVAAFGGYTPIYPFVRKLVPPLAYFRFPVKYLAVTVFACAVLAAEGWDLLRPVERGSSTDDSARAPLMPIAKWAGIIAVAMALAVLGVDVLHQSSWNRAYALASWLKISHPDTAADLIMRLGPPLFGRAAGLLLAGAALFGVATTDRPRSRAAAYLLFFAVGIDLGITNSSLNLSTDIHKLTPPAWYTRLSSAERLYIGGRVRGFMNTADNDAAQSWKVPAENTAVEGRMELNAELPMAPSGWRVREALSYDLPVLWPSEYEAVVRLFEHAGRQQRDAFLRRSGVRWCIVPSASEQPIVEVAHWETKLFECGPTATRVFTTTNVSLGSNGEWQRAALFDASEGHVKAQEPAKLVPAGRAGSPETPPAPIVEDGANDVTIEAGLPAEGFVVLRDSFDPSWRATVDGMPAEIGRANGLYRAVRVLPGHHVIRFRYRPRALGVGLTISGMAALTLLTVCLRFRRTPSARGPRGFTLVELMIVMAILGIILAIAFARYHNMQARGNEASAVASMRSIAAAEWSFALTCGRQKYAPTLVALGQPVPATGAAFLSPDLTSGEVVEKSGYQFQITGKPLDDVQTTACNGAPLAAGYAATADPSNPGWTGTRFFAVNADRVVFEDTQTFKENMPESGAPGHGTEVR